MAATPRSAQPVIMMEDQSLGNALASLDFTTTASTTSSEPKGSIFDRAANLLTDTDRTTFSASDPTFTGLKLLPVELRLKIFTEAFADLYERIRYGDSIPLPIEHGHSPKLLVALRPRQSGDKHMGDSVLYEEALEALASIGIFHAYWARKSDYGHTYVTGLSRRLEVQFTRRKPHFFSNGSDHSYHDTVDALSSPPSESMVHTLENAKNLTDLALSFPMERCAPEHSRWILEKAVRCIKSFPKLAKFTITMVHSDEALNRHHSRTPEWNRQCDEESDVITKLSKGFGFRGEIDTSELAEWWADEDRCTEIHSYTWIAKPKEVLVLQDSVEVSQ